MNRVEQITNQNADAALRPASRFLFVDGLRGFAALGIATYHIWRYEPLEYPSLKFVPPFADWLLCHTWIGVQVLLVISGFVIAYSLRNTWVTPREALTFVGRRLIRLAPPYWLTLFLAVLVNWACLTIWKLPASIEEPVSAVRVMTHMAFSQDIFEQPALSAGLWTVCIEVQFYVVCVLGWGLAQRLAPCSPGLCGLGQSPPSGNRPTHKGSGYTEGCVLLALFGPLALVSLAQWSRLDSTEPYVTHFFGLFFLGMLTWWTLDRVVPTAVFLVTMGIAAGIAVWIGKLELLIALTTALSIFLVGRAGHLHDWLNWRWLQHLAKISYSLYLVHYPLSHASMWWCWRRCSNDPTPFQATAILTGCLAMSLVAAHVLYLTVEAPSIRWSAKLKGSSVPSV